MKITLNNNAELVIQANVNKAGDYEAAMKVAEKMVDMDDVTCDIACVDEFAQWIHVCARWDNFQAKELKELFYDAKKQV